MRILGGLLKGRQVKVPDIKGLRPTPQMVREALFDILGEMTRGANVLDLFAGSGAFGLEALSRGADFCVFVDISSKAVKEIRLFLEKVGFKEKGLVLRWDLGKGIPRGLEGRKFSVVFMDPPYDSNLALKVLGMPEFFSMLKEGAKIIVESRKGSVLPEEVQGLIKSRSRAYGDTEITIYEHALCPGSQRLEE